MKSEAKSGEGCGFTNVRGVGPAIMNDRIRVLSVDDHPRMREGIALVINSQPNMVMVAQATGGREAIERFREHKPDVTLMDLRLPDMTGIDAAVAIRTEFPEARIIILTTFDSDTDQQRALAAGASAFVLKSLPPGKLLDIIHQIYAG